MKPSEAQNEGEGGLTDLVQFRRQWVAEQRRSGVEGVMKAVCLALPLPPSFHDALRVPRAENCVIAEIRHTTDAAPGAGAWVERLEALGASAFSVSVADGRESSWEDVRSAAQSTSLPILCRDLVVDPLQIVMARAHGAAAIALDPSLVSEREFRALYWQAIDMGMDVVLEARTAHDLEAGMRVRRGGSEPQGGIRIVGIDGAAGGNGRHANYERLMSSMPEFAVGVAMTGIQSCDDIRALQAIGYDAFLVGDLLLNSDDLSECMRRLAGDPVPV